METNGHGCVPPNFYLFLLIYPAEGWMWPRDCRSADPVVQDNLDHFIPLLKTPAAALIVARIKPKLLAQPAEAGSLVQPLLRPPPCPGPCPPSTLPPSSFLSLTTPGLGPSHGLRTYSSFPAFLPLPHHLGLNSNVIPSRRPPLAILPPIFLYYFGLVYILLLLINT